MARKACPQLSSLQPNTKHPRNHDLAGKIQIFGTIEGVWITKNLPMNGKPAISAISWPRHHQGFDQRNHIVTFGNAKATTMRVAPWVIATDSALSRLLKLQNFSAQARRRVLGHEVSLHVLRAQEILVQSGSTALSVKV